MGALQSRTSLSHEPVGTLINHSAGGGIEFSSPSEYETLSGLLRVLRRRWKTVALVMLSIFALGALVCLVITPKYSSTVVIEVDKEDHAQSVTADAGTVAPSSDELKTEVATDINVLQSDGLALAVIQDLDLIQVRPFSAAVVKAEKGKPLSQAPRTRERLIARFAKNLTVESPLDTRLINVTFVNPDPSIASNVANALTQKFIDGAMDRRHKSTVQSSYWLRRELDDLKKQVEDSEQKLADYQRRAGLAGLQLAGGTAAGAAGSTPHSTVTDRLFELNQELTAAESSRISAETIYHLVQSQDPEVVLGLSSMNVTSGGGGGGGGALTGDGGIQLVRSLRTQEAALTQEYAGAAVKYGANNPRLATVQQQLDDVRGQMRAELARISKRAQNAYLYAKRNEDTIRQEFTKQQSAANLMADDTVHLQVLAQEAYSNRSLYESLFSKLQTASLASGVRATRVDVVDEARPAGTPSVPNYLKVLAAILGAGLFFGVSSAFVRESLDESIRRPRDLQEIPGVPLLGYVPSLGAKSLGGGNSKLIETPKAPFSEAFRGLRTTILRANPVSGTKAFLVTSASGRDGKTTVVYNLGVAFAQQGARVLLIDCDLRNPDLHRLFGCPVEPGVSDLKPTLHEDEVLGETRHKTLSNLSLLPAGHPAMFPAEFFESEAFDALLRVSAAQYDVVLIDSPPLLSVTDTSIIASKVVGTIAVVRSGVTTRTMLTGLAEALQRSNAPLVGVVLNDVQNPAADGFHGYSYFREEGGRAYEAV